MLETLETKKTQFLDAVTSLAHRCEARQSNRIPLTVCIEGHQLDDDYNVVGDPVLVVTVDVSNTGIGFMAIDRIQTRFLQLHIPEAGTIRAEVKWQQSTGMGPYTRYGAAFVFEGDSIQLSGSIADFER